MLPEPSRRVTKLEAICGAPPVPARRVLRHPRPGTSRRRRGALRQCLLVVYPPLLPAPTAARRGRRPAHRRPPLLAVILAARLPARWYGEQPKGCTVAAQRRRQRRQSRAAASGWCAPPCCGSCFVSPRATVMRPCSSVAADTARTASGQAAARTDRIHCLLRAHNSQACLRRRQAGTEDI